MNDTQTAIGSKITRLIVFFGVTGVVLWLTGKKGITFDSVSAALMFGVLAYIAVSVLGSIRRIIGSLLVSILVMVGLAVLAGMGLDRLVKAHILSDESSFYIVLAIGLLLVIWNIISIVITIRNEKLLREYEVRKEADK